MRKISILIITIIIFCLVGLFIYNKEPSISTKKDSNKTIVLKELTGMTKEEIEEYAKNNGIKINFNYEYDEDTPKNQAISQEIPNDTKIKKDTTIKVVLSKGAVPIEVYQENKVNELGSIPIMMYHGIVNIPSNETKYTGGNVDKDGYNRTAEAFRNDLEFYYQNNYRMIRLQDYIDGNIKTPLGKSPLILTFDDGNENNFKVLGEKDGKLIIDPNCAVGILEEFKKKYPDYNVTATLFVNEALFNQEGYNSKILNYLVDNGYDIGNHTMTHVDFTKVDLNRTYQEVGGIYKLLDSIIPNKYVNIVALPFGSPYKTSNSNYPAILEGTYNGYNYKTVSTLRVGWEAEVSCFDTNFTPSFLKRIRAYDNNGKDFDIEMNFKLLETKRYISDGNPNTIVIKEANKERVTSTTKKVITY